MSRNLINEDSNQFGPGTDLMVCLLALLLIFVVVVSYLYKNEKGSLKIEKTKIEEYRNLYEKSRAETDALKKENGNLKEEVGRLQIRGSFEPGGEFLVAGTFKQNPYYELENPQATENEVQNIVQKYKDLSDKYPFIFVIGHANEVGVEGKPGLSYEERLKYNWEFASVRSAIIANLIQQHLSTEEKNKIIIVSTGEFDLKRPEEPESSENAFVEVFFGNEWKPQAYK